MSWNIHASNHVSSIFFERHIKRPLLDGACKDAVADVVIGNAVVNGFAECNGHPSLEGVGDVVVDIGAE